VCVCVYGQFDLPTSVEVKPDLVYGGILFGLGWAIGGVCPGPGVVGLSGGYGMSMLMWLLGCVAGQQAAVIIPKLLKSPKAPAKSLKSDADRKVAQLHLCCVQKKHELSCLKGSSSIGGMDEATPLQ